MIDLFYSRQTHGRLRDFYNSLERGLRRRTSNPSIFLFPEYALNLYLCGSYPISRILEGIPAIPDGPETFIFFTFNEPREDKPEYAAVKGCTVNNRSHVIVPIHIDIGGPKLKYEGPNVFSYLERDTSEEEYETRQEYPLFTIDGRKIEFRVCWDVWAKTKNNPDLVLVSAYGLDHRRSRNGIYITLEGNCCPMVINDGKRGLTIYAGGSRYDGDNAIETAKQLELNIRSY